jgi:hypothetical protein
VNGDSNSTNEKGPSLVGLLDFCPALAVLVSSVQNIIFLTAHFITLLVPIAQQPGQAGVLAGSPVS